MFAILAIAKGFFGSIFGFIFKDWRITLMIVILALCGFGFYKYHKVQANLEETQKVLKVEQENNETLRKNLDVAVQVNKANDDLMKRMQEDSTLTRKQIATLNNLIAGRNRQVDDLTRELSLRPSAPITPNIAYTVEAIQKMRDEAAKGEAK